MFRFFKKKQSEDLIEELRAENEQLRQQLAILEGKLKHDNDKLLSCIGLEAKYIGLETKYEGLQSAHDDFRSKHLNLLSEHKDLRSSHQVLQTTHQGLRLEHERLRSEHEDLRSRYRSLQLSHKGLEVTHKGLLSEHLKLQSRYKNLQFSIQNEQIDLEMYAELKAKEMKDMLSSQKIITKKQEVMIKSYKIQCESLKDEVAAYQAFWDDVLNDRDATNKEKLSNRKIIANLRNYLNTYVQKFKTQLTRNRELMKDRKRLQAIVNELTRRMDEIKALQEGGSETYKSVLQRVEETEESVVENQEIYDIRKKILADLKEEIKEKKAAIANSQSDIKKHNEIIALRNERLNRKIMKLEKMQAQFEQEKKLVAEIYPQFRYVLSNHDNIKREWGRLKNIEKEVEKLRIEKEYDALIQKKADYVKEKEKLDENLKNLEREQKWFRQEQRLLEKQEDKYFDYVVRVQSKLYAEIEKNERTLFIIRSLNQMNPLYEKVTEDLVASIRNKNARRMVSSFLKGESVYEIAQAEGKTAASVRRVFLLSVNALRKAQG